MLLDRAFRQEGNRPLLGQTKRDLAMMAEHKDSLDHDDLLWRQGCRISLRELMIWITAIPVALAVPIWFDLPLLPVIFYGTLGALVWRLSKAMYFKLAVVIAFAAAVALTWTSLLILTE
ncbi:MAG: hypothetical protein QGF59_16525 [Pirellulaceae bacterium]|jgi:hypothetical protein|nr:hypothetical protein [Planctomycetaceae bacterium]MDP6720268.1 hypothetical protein [Pirellulaceae bacterium]